MKKILVLTVIALFVMMPFASFAKTAVSDSDLGAVTAQSGVSIDFSGLSISNVSQSINSWGDTDGFGSTYSSMGWVGQASTMVGTVLGLSGTLNIDVGSSGTKTRINIDLPTITIGSMNIDSTIKLAQDKTLTTGASTLGMSYMAGVQATISGSLQIYAH